MFLCCSLRLEIGNTCLVYVALKSSIVEFSFFFHFFAYLSKLGCFEVFLALAAKQLQVNDENAVNNRARETGKSLGGKSRY